MQDEIFSALRARIAEITPTQQIGRIRKISGMLLEVKGLPQSAALADRVGIEGPSGQISGEILRLAGQQATILPDSSTEGLQVGAVVTLAGRTEIAPHGSWMGRIIDPAGVPLDGSALFPGPQPRPVRSAAPAAALRRMTGTRLSTGLRVFNTLLPIVRGQRIGLFAGSGVGKSSLLARLAIGIEADVVVFALIGERGRELRNFTEQVLGPEGMKRAVVVAATSDQAPQIRRRCAYTAMTIAEYFREEGKHVLLIADSITRFAEAHREIALALGESAGLDGFPPSVSHMIMSLAERAGPGPENEGDITAVFSVLVPGSDMEGPIADILRGTLDGHVVLDRRIAERGRYPAIDLLRSVSRSLPDAATTEENDLILRARRLLGAWDRAEMMIQAGLYTKGSDSLTDQAIAAFPGLDTFLAEDEPQGISESFRRLASCLPDQSAG